MKNQSLVFMILMPLTVHATLTFERTYDAGIGHQVVHTSDSGYAIAGTYSTGREMIYVLKTDSLGDVLWTTVVSQPYVHKAAYSLQELTDGGFITVGYRDSLLDDTDPADVYLVRFSPAGDTVWSKVYGGDSLDQGYWIEKTADGNFIVAGETRSYGAGNSDVWFMKLDTVGNILWSQTYGGASYDAGRCAKQVSDGGFVIAGSTYSSGAGCRDMYLVKTDSLGNLIWSKTYGGCDYDWAYDIDTTISNGYIIVGSTNSFGVWGRDIFFVRVDTLGDTLWTRTYGDTGDDVAYSVALTPDNGYIVVGYIEPVGDDYCDAYIIKTDSSGNVVWSKTYGGTHNECMFSVENTGDNGYIISGFTDSSQPHRMIYLLKVDSLGNVGVVEFRSADAITEGTMFQISPNPFSRLTNISFGNVQGANGIELKIHDATGRLVKSLSLPTTHSLLPTIIWDGTDSNGQPLTSGVYFVHCETQTDKIVEKVVLLRK